MDCLDNQCENNELDVREFYAPGTNLYLAWVKGGNTGSVSDFLEWLRQGPTGAKGEDGIQGPQGPPGANGISTFDTLKLGLPFVVANEQEYINTIAKLITQDEKVDWEVTNTEGTVTNVTAPISVPPIVNNSGSTDPNNLPKGSYFNFSINADAATGTIIGNINSKSTGEGPFTYSVLKFLGSPIQSGLFKLESNGDVKVLNGAAMLAQYVPGVATGPTIEYQVIDKYGTPSSLNPIAGGYKIVISIMPPADIPYVGTPSRDFTVVSNKPINTILGVVLGNDKAGNAMTYSVADTTNFNINSSTGELSIKLPSSFIYNPDVAPENNIRVTTVNVSNGTNSVNVVVSVTVIPSIISTNQEIAISSDGRSIVSVVKSLSATSPGTVYTNAYGAERANIQYEITITKSNSVGANLGVLVKRLISGPILPNMPITDFLSFDQDILAALSPYDQITKFVMGISFSYNTAHRAQYNATPFSINGIFGPPIPPGGVNTLTLTRELTTNG